MKEFHVIVTFQVYETSPIAGCQSVHDGVGEAVTKAIRQYAGESWQRAVTPPNITVADEESRTQHFPR